MVVRNSPASKPKFDQCHLPRNWNEFMQLIASIHITALVFGPFMLIPVYVLLLLMYPQLCLLAISYYSWVYFDTKIAYNGGRRSDWWSNLAIFRYLRRYFATRVIKTTDLSADRNYLMVLYPHGLVPFSASTGFFFGTNRTTKLFPGITFRYVTLNINLYLPFLREHILATGGCSCSEFSLSRLLGSESSTAAVILPGGAAEASRIRPGNVYTINKSRRKGFVRVALKTGASLVPVFSFNEQNVYDHHDTDVWWLRPFKVAFHRCSGLSLIVPKGRGLFQNRFGFLPRKIPLNTVVGRPIHLPKVENPSNALIDEYHETFFVALVNLFEEHKKQYDIFGEDAKLILL